MNQPHFEAFRQHIIGIDHTFETPYGRFPMLYADWTASGRLYGPIEDFIRQEVLPVVGNTHTETSHTGCMMTKAYEEARRVIKAHVNAQADDVLLFAGSGMTGAVNKLQRILGLRIPERIREYLQPTHAGLRLFRRKNRDLDPLQVAGAGKPVVFVSHMEHHSNQTSWLETIADLEIIPHTPAGEIDIAAFQVLLHRYQDRVLKIASITGCSNVTGLTTPYQAVARAIHAVNGYCFVDFACSGPYVKIDMHPADPAERLDAIFLSPHKFLGGPGTSGLVIFNAKLYNNRVPDNPGGGTVVYTNPWKFHAYIADIETREDGGTPPFLQAIRTAMAFRLKEEMGVDNILAREAEQLARVFAGLDRIPGLHILANQHRHRLGVVSLVIKDMHYNLVVRLLNDRFGIQARGGCACAGTYGHMLLELSHGESDRIFEAISHGDQSNRPGWVRISVHPTMRDSEIDRIVEAFAQIVANRLVWSQDYRYNGDTNAYDHIGHAEGQLLDAVVHGWFDRAYT
jgi:selenocysteine lyase/cysteine desulfurase